MAAPSICKHNQKGFCKFGDHCRNRHVKEICGSDHCRIEICELRHPLKCRFFSLNGECKFEEHCAYLHQESEAKIRVNHLERKLAVTEAKVEELERALEEIKTKLVFSATHHLNDKPCEPSEQPDDYLEESGKDDSSEFTCNLCDFKSSWKNGLIVHMGRKHGNIEQLDGMVNLAEEAEDKTYLNTELYWKRGVLGTSYQIYLDANDIIERSDFSEKEKEEEKAAILEARKEAFGNEYKYYPPWR